MKIEEGGYYLIATGEVLGPMISCGEDIFVPQLNRTTAVWSEDGRAFINGIRESRLDVTSLVSVAVKEPPKPIKLWINVVETPEGGYMTYSFPSEAEALECPFLEEHTIVHKRAIMIEFTPEVKDE